MSSPLPENYKFYGKIRAEEIIKGKYFPNDDNRSSYSMNPTYRLVNVDFNANTLYAKLLFEKSQQYKTVVKYVQRNYERTPIYSDWKVKTSTISKSIKLTNAVLEDLNYVSDFLISAFSMHIILALDNSDMMPSWFERECLDCELVKRKQAIKAKIEHTTNNTRLSVKNCNATIDKEKKSEIVYIKKIKRAGKKLNKIDKKISKIETHKRNVVLYILSFSILALLNSKKRLHRLNKIRSKRQEKLNDLQIRLNGSLSAQAAAKEKIKVLQANLNTYVKKLNEEISATEVQFLQKQKNIKPLNTSVCNFKQDEAFIPLKEIISLEYEKIIGVYVIKNNEKNKYYVGQSKDVLKRIRQHFKGTVPANMTFAEDYFSSTWDKENLFAVKIIQLHTKDELDATEKRLIKEYDSRLNGYNGTFGNS